MWGIENQCFLIVVCVMWHQSWASMRRSNGTHLEIETVEQLRNEGERREEDLQDVNIRGMSLTQLNGGLQQEQMSMMEHWHAISATTWNILQSFNAAGQQILILPHTLNNSVRGRANVSSTSLISDQSSLDLNSCRYLQEQNRRDLAMSSSRFAWKVKTASLESSVCHVDGPFTSNYNTSDVFSNHPAATSGTFHLHLQQ